MLNERTGKELEQFQMRNNKLVQESEHHSVMFQGVVQDLQKKTAELKVSTRKCMHPIRYVVCSESNASYLFPWKLQEIQRAQQQYLIEQILSYKTLFFIIVKNYLCIFASDEQKLMCLSCKYLHQWR